MRHDFKSEINNKKSLIKIYRSQQPNSKSEHTTVLKYSISLVVVYWKFYRYQIQTTLKNYITRFHVNLVM